MVTHVFLWTNDTALLRSGKRWTVVEIICALWMNTVTAIATRAKVDSLCVTVVARVGCYRLPQLMILLTDCISDAKTTGSFDFLPFG